MTGFQMRPRGPRLAPWLAGLLLAPLVAAAAQGADGGSGAITAVVDHPAQVRAVSAVDRQGRTTFPGSVDGADGTLSVGGLPLEATYDCIIDYAHPAESRLDGVNMTVPRSDYVEEQPLSEEDIATIRSKIRKMNQFEDVVEVLAIEGNIQHAAVVINKLRTQPFYDSKPGEVIWRLELWHYERPEETWYKTQDELSLVLYRERIPRSAYDKKSIVLDPALGGLRLSVEQPTMDLGKVLLPPVAPGISVRDGQDNEEPREQKP